MRTIKRRMKVGATCLWTVKEKNALGRYVPVYRQKNKLTVNGLTNLAAAWGGAGTYTAPQYLVVDQAFGSFQTAPSVGATSVVLTSRVDISGDTQLVLSAGLASQEIVTYSGVSGSGPYTYALTSPTTKTHLVSDPVLRQINENDLMSSVVNEMQYDASNDPGHRALVTSGYSPASGSFTMQFFLTGIQALGNLMTIGLSENNNVGSGTLHNHCILGYFHAAGKDIEIDVTLTLSNA